MFIGLVSLSEATPASWERAHAHRWPREESGGDAGRHRHLSAINSRAVIWRRNRLHNFRARGRATRGARGLLAGPTHYGVFIHSL